MADELTHLDAQGRARMVDVTRKAQTERFAVARCSVTLSEEAIAVVAQRGETDPLASARVAGMLAAKRTSDFIPLCHPLLIGDVSVDFVVGAGEIEIEARVETFGQTGVEMEALTACAAAALAISDICRSTDPLVSIGGLAVWEKRGGKSGNWRRQQPEGPE